MPPTSLRHPELLLARSSAGLLPRLDRDGALHRVRAGVYVRRADWASLLPWERYLVRVRAVAATWSSPILGLESAAILLGLPTFGEPRDIHLFDPDRATTWREGDVIVHGSRDPRPIEMVAGHAVTSILDTAVDLGRVLPPAFGLAVVDAAARALGDVSALRVADHGRSQDNRRGVRRLDWLQERADPTSESAGESVSRAVVEWLGYERPELQVVFRAEGAEDRVDFFWRRQGVAGESDGYGKYDADDPEATKSRLIAEKRREDRLRRQVSGFARWDWADAMNATRLEGILASAGLAAVHRRDAALLATLRSHPRSLAAASRDRRSWPRQGPGPRGWA